MPLLTVTRRAVTCVLGAAAIAPPQAGSWGGPLIPRSRGQGCGQGCG